MSKKSLGRAYLRFGISFFAAFEGPPRSEGVGVVSDRVAFVVLVMLGTVEDDVLLGGMRM